MNENYNTTILLSPTRRGRALVEFETGKKNDKLVRVDALLFGSVSRFGPLCRRHNPAPFSKEIDNQSANITALSQDRSPATLTGAPKGRARLLAPLARANK